MRPPAPTLELALAGDGAVDTRVLRDTQESGRADFSRCVASGRGERVAMPMSTCAHTNLVQVGQKVRCICVDAEGTSPFEFVRAVST